MSKRKSNAVLRKNQEYMTHSPKFQQTFYQKHETNVVEFNSQKQRKPINLIPKSINQENYILALTNSTVDVVVCIGPAGTGKTYLATLAAIQAYRNKEIERIVITRPAVAVDDEKHGFLPGDLNSKMEPWTKPILDVFREFYAVKEIETMLADQIIEIAPLAFCRGRTFKNSFVILDESQNTSKSQVMMILTRIGYGSKIVLTGDTDQTDHKRGNNGLIDLCDRLEKTSVNGITICKFQDHDVQRHPLIKDIIKLYSHE